MFVAVTVFSLAGTRLAAIAIPWYVLTTSGSPALTGLVALAELGPYVVVKALAGPLIDRVGPVRVSLVSASLTVLAVAAVPALHAAHLLTYPGLVALVALIGILRAPSDGAKTTMIPVVSAASGASLEKVSGAYGAVDRLAATLGAAFGGLLIAAVGGANALWLTVATFGLDVLVVGLVLAPLVARHERRSGAHRSPSSSYFSELREGCRFLRKDSVLVALVGILAVTNMLEQAYGVALLPVWALLTGGGAAAIGLLFATSSVCSVVGAVVAAGLGERLPRRTVYVVAYLVVGLPRFGVLALGLPFPVIAVVLAVSGFAAGFINPIIGAVIVERIPAALMGRVNTMAMACAWALLPLGGLLGGLLVTALGLAPALWIIGIGYLAATMTPLVLPAWRGLGGRVTEPVVAQTPPAPIVVRQESSPEPEATPTQQAR